MAQNATIFKAQIQLSDMDRHHYDSLSLTLARHPSETDERMMVRVLAYILHAHEQLQFTKGLCADDEPDLWQVNYADEIEAWIDVGLPDEKRIRKASSRAQKVFLYAYGGRPVELWFKNIESKIERFDNVTIVDLPQEVTLLMASMTQRSIELQCTIEDGEIWISDMQQEVRFTPHVIFPHSQ